MHKPAACLRMGEKVLIQIDADRRLNKTTTNYEILFHQLFYLLCAMRRLILEI